MLKQGDVIKNKYKVLSLLGEGGMSKVWLCEDKDGIKRAVKEIDKTSNAYKASIKKDGTLTEVEIVKELNHPLIPKVTDVFEYEDSIQIVMECVEGLDLMTVLSALKKKGKRLEEKDILRWAKELAEIFSYLHSRQDPIIYRDLKPSNIMINEKGDVRLLDFGIAKYLSEKDEPVERKYAGTNGFASPEHKKGCPDERSDIFTLGRTLYFLCAGGIPSHLKKTTLKDGSVVERKDYTPVPFSELAITDISPGFEKIIFRCMEKDPEDRYESAAEVLKDLILLDKKHEGKIKKIKRREISIMSKVAVIIILTLIIFSVILFVINLKFGDGTTIRLPGI